MDLKSLTDRSSKLPTVPRVTQRVIASFGSEDVTLGEISELIEADPVLSARLLRLANSSYYQVSRSIETVDEAMRILGMAMVRHLVLAGGLMGSYAKIAGIDLHQFWTYSLYTACAARWLAEHGDANRDLAFSLGLMHGIGQLHLHSVAPAVAVALDQQAHVLSPERVGCETESLGFSYLDVSAALAGVWNFPQSLAEPMQHIADPLCAATFSPEAATVHLGSWHARNTLLETSAEEVRSHYPHAVAARLGITTSWVLPQSSAFTTADLPRIPALHELSHGLDEMLK